MKKIKQEWVLFVGSQPNYCLVQPGFINTLQEVLCSLVNARSRSTDLSVFPKKRDSEETLPKTPSFESARSNVKQSAPVLFW